MCSIRHMTVLYASHDRTALYASHDRTDSHVTYKIHSLDSLQGDSPVYASHDSFIYVVRMMCMSGMTLAQMWSA